MTTAELVLIAGCLLLGLTAAYALHALLRPYLFVGEMRGILGRCRDELEAGGRTPTEAEDRAYWELAEVVAELTLFAPFLNPLAMLLLSRGRLPDVAGPDEGEAGELAMRRLLAPGPAGGPAVDAARARLFLALWLHFTGGPVSYLLAILLALRARRSSNPAEYMLRPLRRSDCPPRRSPR